MPERPRVLLIDDNRENLKVAAAHLEAAGFATRTARDGVTGIERARTGDVDLILLDAQMPGIDGYTTLARLKADPDLAGVPVLFMTARTGVDDKVRAFDAGAVDYITKPFEAPELLARVRTHLELRRLQVALGEQNATLERRVADQVAEVERLNAQLRAQIEDRSDALMRALERLSGTPDHDDGSFVGTLLEGRYRVDEPIGRGGMGTVYRGVDLPTGQEVAIKVIRPSGARPVSLLQRFLKEARTAAAVEHPTIVRLLHVDIDDDGVLYQVQELVDGPTLAVVLDEPGALASVAARVLAVAAEALAAAHAAGVVHRDVKPSNLLLSGSAPGLKLADFGISKRAESHAHTLLPDEITGVGVVLGTPEYMSPEQLKGSVEVGTATDLYALGVVAHQLYTGGYPGRLPTTRIPPVARELVLACLAHDPEDRPDAARVAAHFRSLADASGLPPLESLVREGLLRDNTRDDTPTRFA